MRRLAPVLLSALLAACGSKPQPLTGIIGASSPEAWLALGFAPVLADAAAAGSAGFRLVSWTCEPDKAPAELAKAIADFGSVRPWIALGLRSWTEIPGALGKTKVTIFPARRELRFASYFALIHGARGILYAGVERGDDQLIDYPEQWQALASVARELNVLAPILSVPARPIAAGNLSAALWRAGRDYVIAANPTFETSCLPDWLSAADWRPLFEPRRELQRPVCLAPRQVLVLEGPRFQGALVAR